MCETSHMFLVASMAVKILFLDLRSGPGIIYAQPGAQLLWTNHRCDFNSRLRDSPFFCIFLVHILVCVLGNTIGSLFISHCGTMSCSGYQAQSTLMQHHGT
jgi:hypothetical protein